MRNSDVFILLSDDAGTGMYAELGAAILLNLEHGRPQIYIVGKDNARSMFYFHPAVKRRNSIDDVFDEINNQ